MEDSFKNRLTRSLRCLFQYSCRQWSQQNSRGFVLVAPFMGAPQFLQTEPIGFLSAVMLFLWQNDLIVPTESPTASAISAYGTLRFLIDIIFSF